MSLRRAFQASALILAAAVPGPVLAQVADSAPAAPSGAPVVYATDTLFTLYGRLGPFGPGERATAVERRLAQVSAAIATGDDSIRVVAGEGRHELVVGDRMLMTVLDTDAGPAGETRAVLAQAYARRMTEAVRDAYRAGTLRALLLDAAYALVATLVLVLVLRLLSTLFRRLYALFSGPRLPPLRIKRFELLSARRLGEALTVLARSVRVVLTVLVFYIYLPLVLSFFPWTAPYSRRITGYVLTPLSSVWQGFLDYLPKIFFLVVIFLVTRYLLKVIRLVFRAVETQALTIEGFHKDWAEPTYNIVRFLVIAFAAVVMFPYLPGAGSDAFKGVSLFVGVLFSFGSSGAVSNIIAGVVLTYTRAFQIGDRVRIGETVGDVVERTLLVTRVRTIKNVDITIPNGAVLSSQVVNYSTQAATRGLILHTTVTIGYDAPWRQVHDLLLAAAAATEHAMADPPPFVLQTSLDDFYVSYELNVYTDEPALMARTYSALHQSIQDQFTAAGVEIMSPHYRALRDGNQVTIPPDQLPPDYRAPSFRVQQTGEPGGGHA